MASTDKKNILVLFAHPALQKSRVNSRLAEALKELDGVLLHDLYQEYPDFNIDVNREQDLLTKHDVVIFQHPFFWYSSPAILKEWQDLVLEHGWAYGSRGTALQGKLFMNVITTGGRETAYHSDGSNHFTVRQLLAPVEQTASLCKMVFLAPFLIHGTHSITPGEISDYVSDYARLLNALREGRVDIEKARKLDRINEDLDQVIMLP